MRSVGCVKAFIQLAGTDAEDRRIGHVDGSCLADPGQRRSARQANLVPAVQAPDVADAGCRVGPGRGARLSTSPFPRTALRVKWAAGEVPVAWVLFRRPLPEQGLPVSRHPALR